MKVVIASHFFGSTSIYALHRHSDQLWIEAQENYQKRSTRNRCVLAGPNGPHIFTIPLEKGKNNQLPIQEVRIADVNVWYSVFLKTIQSFYGKSPFFDFVYPELEALLSEGHTTLWNLNISAMDWIMDFLALDKSVIHFTKNYIPNYDSSIKDYRNDIPLVHSLKNYPQVFEYKSGFQENLSILDLLFCMGPEARLYL